MTERVVETSGRRALRRGCRRLSAVAERADRGIIRVRISVGHGPASPGSFGMGCVHAMAGKTGYCGNAS